VAVAPGSYNPPHSSYPHVDTQAAASFAAWQILEAAVAATRTLDDKALAKWLKANRVDTITGKVRFDGPYNYGPRVRLARK
jgi:ABC-type branched-subunit amino acid transport system substrate-binding protein